ncbi:MAG: hypothetical protein CMM26_07720 [Rhodospirillaceae bacterium]|nr:hypothetical protein [Rhodospirillaceae bacterium]
MPDEPGHTSGDQPPAQRRIHLATFLVGGITLLILLAVGGVLALTRPARILWRISANERFADAMARSPFFNSTPAKGPAS